MLWVIIALIVALGIGVVILYNRLVAKRQMVDNGWSDIAVQLKRRADLIPYLVEAVKAYADYEANTFEAVIRSRNAALSAGNNVSERGETESALSRDTTRLLALAEDYPALKASENFLDLQEQLSETEEKIEFARRFYNGAVRELNTTIETVPSNLIARPLGFHKRDYFEIDPSERAAPEVSFS